MIKTSGGRTQVRAYLAKLPPSTRRVMKQIAAIVRAAAPDAEDAWSYSIPAFRLNGRVFLWYAAWKQHVSLYPFGSAFLRANTAEVKGYKTSKARSNSRSTSPCPRRW